MLTEPAVVQQIEPDAVWFGKDTVGNVRALEILSQVRHESDSSIARPADPYGTPIDAVLLLVDNRPYDIFLFGLQVCDLADR
jgi:hypothetical protein